MSGERPDEAPLDDKETAEGVEFHETRRSEEPEANLQETSHFDNLPQVGKSLGRYRLVGFRGRGGFASVYEGFDTQLQRRVAIKVPHAHLMSDDLAETILREARRVAQLRHPGITTVFDVGMHEGQCFIVSDFVDGVSLDGWLTKNRPDWREVCEIVEKVAEALAHAHANGIIHRDIKPANIMLRDDGQPVVLDFGLAISDADATERELGRVSGTPAFMAPEQALGRAHRIDGRTDVYSLGVTLYYLLTRRIPFRGSDYGEILRQVREDEPQPPRQVVPEIPRELEAVCLKAMSKHLNDRYVTAGDLADALRAVPGSAASPPAESRTEPTETPRSVSYTTSATRLSVEAGRRQLTVLLCNCDLEDSEQLLEELDPEDQHELLGGFHDVVAQAIQDFGGTLLPSAERALFVCFGYPISQEDAAQRAIRAALRIREEMEELNVGRPATETLAVWTAIHTGTVVITESTSGDSLDAMSIVGAARNVAVRLEGLADPGQILISQATHHLVQGMFACQDLGSQALRGMSKPLAVFNVEGEGDIASRIELEESAGLMPLVGRDTELSILRERWEQVLDGKGQVVLLVGEAGIGKSRLVHTMKQELADEQASRIEWRCSAYYQNTSLHAAADYFQRCLGIQRTDTDAARLDKLSAYLATVNMDDDENTALFASLLSIPLDERIPALNLTPIRLKEKTLEVLTDWLYALSSRQPVMFAVEDLHWIDPTTLELLVRLINECANEQMLLLCTFRPDYEPNLPNRGYVTQISLNPLTKRQVHLMMEQRLGAGKLTEELVSQIVARTDCVPLFVEEFTKILQESDALSDVSSLDNLSGLIPATLKDLLTARLDRMNSVPEVVQLASALGREFNYELMAAAAEMDEEVLRKELSKLVHAEFLFQRGRPPKCTYTFKHALIQDAAYQTLLKKQRQEIHSRIVTALENAADSPADLLAHHCSAAGVTEQAISYWLQAGQHSMSRSAVLEAVNQLQSGIDLVATLPESPERMQLELAFQIPMATALIQSRGYAAAEVGDTLERARELSTRAGDGSYLFAVLMGTWLWRLVRGDFDSAQQIAAEIMSLAEGLPDPAAKAEAFFFSMSPAFYQGVFDKAIADAQQGHALFDIERSRFYAQFSGQNSGVTIQVYWALALWHLGYPTQALDRGRQAVALARELNDAFSLAFALYHLGWVQTNCRLPQQVRETGQACLELSSEQGFAIWKTLGEFCQGAGIWLQDGTEDARKKEALQMMSQGLNGFRATGASLHVTHCYVMLAEAHHSTGDIEGALEPLELGFQVVQQNNERFAEAELYRVKGEILLSMNREAEAEACWTRSLEVARAQQAKSWELRTALTLARFWNERAKRQQAIDLLSDVMGWFSEGFETPDVRDAQAFLESLGHQ